MTNPLDNIVNIFSGNEVEELAKNDEGKKAKFFGRKIVVNAKNGNLERVGYGTYLLERIKSFFDSITKKPAEKIKMSRQDFCNRELAGYRLILEVGKGVDKLLSGGGASSEEDKKALQKKLQLSISLANELANEIKDERLNSKLNGLANSLKLIYEGGDLVEALVSINNLALEYQEILNMNSQSKYAPFNDKINLLSPQDFRAERIRNVVVTKVLENESNEIKSIPSAQLDLSIINKNIIEAIKSKIEVTSELREVLKETPDSFINENAPKWIETFIDNQDVEDIFAIDNINRFIGAIETLRVGPERPVTLNYTPEVLKKYLDKFVGGNLDVDHNEQLPQGVYDIEPSKNKVEIALKLANIQVGSQDKLNSSKEVAKVIIRNFPGDDAKALAFSRLLGLEEAFYAVKKEGLKKVDPALRKIRDLETDIGEQDWKNMTAKKEMDEWINSLNLDDDRMALMNNKNDIVKKLEGITKEFLQENADIWITKIIDKLPEHTSMSALNLNAFLRALDKAFEDGKSYEMIPDARLNLREFSTLEHSGLVEEWNQRLVSKFLEKFTRNGTLLYDQKNNPIKSEDVKAVLRLANIHLKPEENLIKPEDIRAKIKAEYPDRAEGLLSILGLEERKPTGSS